MQWLGRISGVIMSWLGMVILAWTTDEWLPFWMILAGGALALAAIGLIEWRLNNNRRALDQRIYAIQDACRRHLEEVAARDLRWRARLDVPRVAVDDLEQFKAELASGLTDVPAAHFTTEGGITRLAPNN